MRAPQLLLVFVSILAFAAAVQAADRRPNEIVVSAANYAETPPKELSKLFRHADDLPDPPPPAPKERPPRFYQFLRGEVFEADATYEDVCRLLAPALAQKNLHNTSEQAKVEFILRVSFGGRRWRDPLVRIGELEWRQGLVPKKRRGNSMFLGEQPAWDIRAGGDDAALRQNEQLLAELDPTNGAEGMADRLIKGMPTEDYFLVVVDAFEVAQLKAKGNSAERAWTTFIAVPQQGGRKFSQVLAGMIAKATPYFGETLPGKARFTDREGHVEIGEARVVEEAVPNPPEKK